MNETIHAGFSGEMGKDSEVDISLLIYQEWNISQDDNLPIGVEWSDIE